MTTELMKCSYCAQGAELLVKCNTFNFNSYKCLMAIILHSTAQAGAWASVLSIFTGYGDRKSINWTLLQGNGHVLCKDLSLVF